MEDNFRNVLIILSAIVIIAIFFHGVWTIRKQKNPYKLKAQKSKVAPLTRDFDHSGFDQDGVSQVKVSKNETQQSQSSEQSRKAFGVNNTNKSDLSQSQVIKNKDIFTQTSEINTSDITGEDTVKNSTANENSALNNLDNSIEPDWFKDDTDKNIQKESEHSYVDSTNHHFSKDELGDELALTTESDNEISDPKEPTVTRVTEPLYEQPVTQAKPARKPVQKIKKRLTKSELKKDQIELDFNNQPDDKKDNTATKSETLNKELEPQVIILSVVMPVNQQMLGAVLLPSLLTLGLKYGEMNIFHRHEDNAGNGKVTFSLANILNPGTFDLDSMENFATRGVSLFMTLPNAGDSSAVFEQMLNAAKQLGKEFNAQVLDDKRNVLTKQSEQHYFNIIREFDRKNRIALAE